jgi:glycerophosphoryl diester phosphodiesterase
MVDPLFVERDGHRTWIKWHRARRRGSDPVFLGRRVIEGMRLGASVEVDLVVHGGQGFAILHDLTLDRETTGVGPVRDAAPEALRGLHLRGNDGVLLPDTVMLLEDLCALLAETPPHPDALLQLDLKEDRAALSPATVESFAASVGSIAPHMILSGGDADAVRLLAGSAPGLKAGYDPSDERRFEAALAEGSLQGFVDDAVAALPGADMIYLYWEIPILSADAGFDIIGAFHEAGRRVDAWTIKTIDADSLKSIERLLALKVDQITTDDPEGLATALAS